MNPSLEENFVKDMEHLIKTYHMANILAYLMKSFQEPSNNKYLIETKKYLKKALISIMKYGINKTLS